MRNKKIIPIEKRNLILIQFANSSWIFYTLTHAITPLLSSQSMMDCNRRQEGRNRPTRSRDDFPSVSWLRRGGRGDCKWGKRWWTARVDELWRERERERGRERRGRRSRWRRLYARTWAEWAIKTDVERAGECKWSRLLADLFRICLHGTPATLFYIQRGRGQSIPGLGCFAIPGDDAGI